MDQPQSAPRRLYPTPEAARKLEQQWAESFTATCENRSLGLLRRISAAQKDALFAEAKKRSITSYRAMKSLAVELGVVDDYQEPP